MGTRQGLELRRRLHSHRKGMGPMLKQRTAAELLTPDRATSVVTRQPALLRPKEQLRDIESP
eukprot:5102927-Alexandrium_andersonii.AAC.1